MSQKNYLQGFETFTELVQINEMASELTKLGVPKGLMQFIHKLSGEKVSRTSTMDRYGGGGSFHTRKEPYKAKGGPFPEREDLPLSHDAEVQGTKTGKKNIFHYLTDLVDSRKDTGLKLILVNPNEDQIHYITRKTGKLSKAQMRDMGISDTEEARQLGTSQKRGLYIRVVTIDGDSGNPVAAWEGTIGQMADDLDDDSVLYIMENEDRVINKRKERTERTEFGDDKFLDYFVKNYEKILGSHGKANSAKLSKLMIEKLSGLTIEDIAGALKKGHYRDELEVDDASGNDAAKGKFLEILNLKDAIDADLIDIGQLKSKLNNFTELAFKEGKYKNTGGYGDNADLTDMTEKHGIPTVASMFLQYVALGKVYKPFYTDDPFKQLGLDDLLI